MTWHVAGIDLSLTNTGVAVHRGDLERPRLRNVLSAPNKTSRTDDGAAYSSLLDRRTRIQTIAARVLEAALADYDPESDDPPLFVIESPVVLQSNSGQATIDRIGLWWYIVTLLFKRGVVVEVAPTTLKRYATGSGSGRKAGVLASMPYMFPGLFVDDDNTADALVLMAMGARALGFPVEPSPQRVTPSALDAVKWPTNLRRSTT